MKNRGDFHIHSLYSDGIYTVEDLVAIAKAKGLKAMAITDHDVLAGSIAAKSLEDDSLRLLIGLELSTEHNQESIHILGYFNSEEGLEGLDKFLMDQRASRLKRAYKIKDKLLQHFQIDLDMDFVKNISSVTRGSIAREIIEQGYPYKKEEIFSKMIGENAPAYLPSTKLTTEDGIKIIHQYGGLAILAHPVLIKKTRIEDFIKMGIDGIEAIYPANNKSDEDRLLALAKKHNLLVTGGSDFHNENDMKHGNIGEFYLENPFLDIFLEKMVK